MPKLRGAIAAAVTPMHDRGLHIDHEGIERLAAFLAAAGMDGVLACGTTGEGLLLSVDERRRVVERFVASRPPGFLIAVHAGAQTTAATVALSAHALETGADAVAVIAPPYYVLDEDELTHHFVGSASACEPLPFYIYEFEGRSGYAIPVPVIERVRQAVPNLIGLKVSDRPFERVEPYLIDGLDVFIGSEPLVLQGLGRGAVGAVSGLATAFPEPVATLVHDRDPAAHDRVVELRERLTGVPFQAALKQVLVDRDVLLHGDVRPPLRTLTDDERALLRGLESSPG